MQYFAYINSKIDGKNCNFNASKIFQNFVVAKWP